MASCISSSKRLGSTLPSDPAESQTNGCLVHPLPANSPQYPGTINPNHQMREKSKVADSEPPINLGPQASCPDSTIPGSLQLRKLPMTPREEDIFRTEPLNLSTGSQVYESIKDEERKLCSGDWSKGWEGSGLPSRTSSCATVWSEESGGRENGTAEATSMRLWPGDASVPLTTPLECSESHLQLQELTPEQDVPTEPTSAMEKKLHAMYAQVCKKPKADQQLQPANHSRPTEDGEEEPPPIPEKHFDDIYESIDPEMQGGEMPSDITPPDA